MQNDSFLKQNHKQKPHQILLFTFAAESYTTKQRIKM